MIILSSLQTLLRLSFPAQRSAQELPQVEKSSLTSCLVSGGEEMVITGSNFFPESKVIFLEKGPGKCYLQQLGIEPLLQKQHVRRMHVSIFVLIWLQHV